MRRFDLSWCGSLGLHAALLGWLSSAFPTQTTQIHFRQGRVAIELQASVAAAPRAEPEPTPIEMEPKPQPREEKPLEVHEPTAKVERREPELPEPKRTETGTEPPPPPEREVEIEAEELLAVALQHEIDHLEGKLLVDRISRLLLRGDPARGRTDLPQRVRQMLERW